MARASAASKGHNWRLKVFTRALIQMEGLHIPLVRPVLFHLIIIYMNLHRLSCPCSPVFKQIKFYLCNKYKFTLQQILYHKYKIVQLLKGHGRRRTCFCGHTRGNSCYPPCYPGFWNNMKSELNVEDTGIIAKCLFIIHLFIHLWRRDQRASKAPGGRWLLKIQES